MEQKILQMSDRAREKAESRVADERALREGEKSPQQLREENAHFARLNVRYVRSRPLV